MAKIKTSALVSSIKGKYSGSMFSTSNSGAYIKSNSGNRAGQRVAVTVGGATFGVIAATWSRLTINQKKTWQENRLQWSITDHVIYKNKISAYSLFQKLNRALKNIGIPALYNCPNPDSPYPFSGALAFAPMDFSGFYGTATRSNQQIILFNNSAIIPGWSFIIYSAKSRPVNLAYQAFKLKKYLILSGSNSYSYDISTDWRKANHKGFENQEVISIQIFAISQLTGRQSPGYRLLINTQP